MIVSVPVSVPETVPVLVSVPVPVTGPAIRHAPPGSPPPPLPELPFCYPLPVKDRRSWTRQMGAWANLSIVGIQFPVAIAIGYFWGKWLDGYLGTGPWLMYLFAVFGIVAGFVNLFRIAAQAERMEQGSGGEEERKGPGGTHPGTGGHERTD